MCWGGGGDAKLCSAPGCRQPFLRHCVQVKGKLPICRTIFTIPISHYLQAESGIKEKASHMIASIEKQKTDLLRELRQRREKKLVPLKKQLDTLNCFIAEAQGLQVNHKTAGIW